MPKNSQPKPAMAAKKPMTEMRMGGFFTGTTPSLWRRSDEWA